MNAARQYIMPDSSMHHQVSSVRSLPCMVHHKLTAIKRQYRMMIKECHFNASNPDGKGIGTAVGTAVPTASPAFDSWPAVQLTE
jgi:hypothetical protein